MMMQQEMATSATMWWGKKMFEKGEGKQKKKQMMKL
jgi:hypothetical protein